MTQGQFVQDQEVRGEEFVDLAGATFPGIESAEFYSPRNAYSMILFCALSQQEEGPIKKQSASWGYELKCFAESSKKQVRWDAQAALFQGPGHGLLVFRGSEANLGDWYTNFSFKKDQDSWGKVHHGFNSALGTVWNQLLPELAVIQGPLYMAGHSQGGALTHLAAARIAQGGLLREAEGIAGIYTFGAPKVGNKVFRDNFKRTFLSRCFRVVNNNDLVPSMPPLNSYAHVGHLVYMSEGGRLYHQVSKAIKRRITMDERAKGLDVKDFDKFEDHFSKSYAQVLAQLPPLQDFTL